MNLGRSDLQAPVSVRYVRPEGPTAMSTPAQSEQLVIAGQQFALPHGIYLSFSIAGSRTLLTTLGEFSTETRCSRAD